MPAFARKYSMTCKTCHAPFPKLKPYGEEFAGERLRHQGQGRRRAITSTRATRPLSLLRDVPIAFRLEGFLAYNNADARRRSISPRPTS